jgi:hypothetical protein
MGKVHTTEHILKLHHHDGEYIIGLSGTYKEWIETLTITTNKRSVTYGGNIDHRQKQWKPASKQIHATAFSITLPIGHRVMGLYGGYGVHIHNIGAVYQPVSEQDLKWGGKKKCSISKCFFGEIKRKLSSNKLPKVHD